MTFLLDTDVCSFCMRKGPPVLLQRVSSFPAGELKVSTVTVYELFFGAHRHGASSRWLGAVEAFLPQVGILDFDASAARHAAEIRAELARAGTPIGAYDLQIAGHARSLAATLVTHNTREFSRVSGLDIVDWTEP